MLAAWAPAKLGETILHATDFMAAAIAISRRADPADGTAPYGAVVVRGGAIVGEGLNHVRARHDPTSHGEVEAIRDACRRLSVTDLSDCDLYTSCEPCPMCVATMTVAGIRKLYYAATLADSAEAMRDVPTSVRRRIDGELVRHEAGRAVSERRTPSEQLSRGEAVTVLRAWADEAARYA